MLGTGDVGQRLASGFLSKGYPVTMGTRTPDKEDVRSWLKGAGPGAAVQPLPMAAKTGDVIVLATAWHGTENALTLAGHENLRGKLLLDVTNPLAHGPDGPTLALGHTDSGGEQVQRWAPGARVVKALNVVTNAMMVDPPRLDGHTPDMPYCGDDEAAKREARALLRDLGWPDASLLDYGPLRQARLLEPLAMLWIAYGIQNDHWTHAWKLLGR